MLTQTSLSFYLCFNTGYVHLHSKSYDLTGIEDKLKTNPLYYISAKV